MLFGVKKRRQIKTMTTSYACFIARPLVQTLPLRTTVNNGTVLPKKPSGSLPSPSGARKETASPAVKRYALIINLVIAKLVIYFIF